LKALDLRLVDLRYNGRTEPCLARKDSGMPTPIITGLVTVFGVESTVRAPTTDHPPALPFLFRTDHHRLLTGCVPILDNVNQRLCHHMAPLPDPAL
jgi:hypothetical protein